MESYTIREAIDGDAAGIARVHINGWRRTYTGLVPAAHLAALSHERHETFWRRVLSDAAEGSSVFVIVDEENRIVGFASGGRAAEGDPGYQGQLHAIYIDAR